MCFFPSAVFIEEAVVCAPNQGNHTESGTMHLSQRVNFVAIFLFTLFSSSLFSEEVFTSGKNAFLLNIEGVSSYYNTRMFSVLPGESVSLEALLEDEPTEINLFADAGMLEQISDSNWRWTAPDVPGLYPISLENEETDESVTINAFVLHPYGKVNKKGYLGHYRIGKYPKNPIYEQPKGFIEVTEGNQNVRVSPHFQLKQFLCKQFSVFPKFMMLSERLLIKLEMILEKLNEKKYRGETLQVMSGYRTPIHNRRNARYSRHMWGDASDILVESDLNEDGKIDFKDSLALREIVEGLETDFPDAFSAGGFGLYTRAGFHGPFVHVDARGFSARWINHPRRRHKRHARR